MSVSNATEDIDQVQFDRVRILVLKDTPTGKTTLMGTGFGEDGEELVEILEWGCDGADRVIVTHDDHGHHGGLLSVIEAFDPELVASANESKFHEAIDYEPGVMFTGSDLLDGDIRVVEMPDHTKATSALLLEDHGIPISGDALDRADRADLPAGHLLPPPTLFDDGRKAIEISLYDLLQHNSETLLVFHSSHVFKDPKGKLDDFLVGYERDPRSE